VEKVPCEGAAGGGFEGDRRIRGADREQTEKDVQLKVLKE